MFKISGTIKKAKLRWLVCRSKPNWHK